MNTIDLEVKDMSCGSCVKHVTQALQTVTGVSHVEVDLPTGHVRVSGEFAQGSLRLIEALAKADYTAQFRTSAAAATTPQTSGSQSSPGGKSGCCCR